jgi:hypothetical protein
VERYFTTVDAQVELKLLYYSKELLLLKHYYRGKVEYWIKETIKTLGKVFVVLVLLLGTAALIPPLRVKSDALLLILLRLTL